MTPAQRQVRFPVTANFAYFNHAAVAPLPQCAAEAMERQVGQVARQGVHGYGDWLEEYSGLRAAAASMLGCGPDEIAITKNTSEGLCAVAGGLDWRAGDVVVGLESDFPANSVPWMALQRRHGVRFRSLRPRQGILGLEDLDRACRGARLAALSHVHFLTGFRWDLAAAGEICRRRGCLLVVDAVQGMGAFPIDVKEAGVHALSASGHKWLLGPEGCGVLYLDRDWMPALEPVELGWCSLEGFESYRANGPLQPTARRFECGTLNTVGSAGLRASIEALNSVGATACSQAIHSLVEHLLSGARARGYHSAADRTRANGSGILSLRKRGVHASSLVAELLRQGISVAERMGWVRVAPHYYNTHDEIDRLLAALP